MMRCNRCIFKEDWFCKEEHGDYYYIHDDELCPNFRPYWEKLTEKQKADIQKVVMGNDRNSI